MRRILVILLVLGVGYAFYAANSRVRSPAETAFRDASRQIASYHDAVGFGNNAEARQLAIQFAQALQEEQSRHFTGGAQRSVSLTKDHFLVYCQLNAGSACFLVHVPQLKNYHDDVRQALAELAWTVARPIVEPKLGAQNGELSIGLRGSALYGAIAQGHCADVRPMFDIGKSVKTEPLHRYFSPPAPPAPQPTTAPQTSPAPAAPTPTTVPTAPQQQAPAPPAP